MSPPGRLSTEVPFSPFEQSLQSERAEILRASKATLTLREELFLELVYRDNRTFEAAGAMVGVSRSGALRMNERILLRLRKDLAGRKIVSLGQLM